MGLTLHYTLQARGNETKARNLIAQLHQAAHDLPFKELGEIVDLSGNDCDFDRRDKDDPLGWLLIQAQNHVTLKKSHRMANGELGDYCITVVPVRVIAFTAWPGEGCEESNFGLCRYPAHLLHPLHGKVNTKLSGWHWESFCKTQYASNPKCGGTANFLRCHLTVIALLDHARKLGCLGEVSDEGKFWNHRDARQLADEVGSWNEMIAALGGKLKDTLGEGLQSAIAEFPNFEALEAGGQHQLPPETEALAKLLQRVVQKSGVTP